MEAHESVVSHRERTRRVAIEHTRAEAAVNHSLGNLGCCVKEAAAANHSLTCGVPESNEIRCRKQATELIEEWHNQLQGVPPVSRPSSVKLFSLSASSVTHQGLEFANLEGRHSRIMSAVSSCNQCFVFVCCFNDDVGILAHRVGRVCSALFVPQ